MVNHESKYVASWLLCRNLLVIYTLLQTCSDYSAKVKLCGSFPGFHWDVYVLLADEPCGHEVWNSPVLKRDVKIRRWRRDLALSMTECLTYSVFRHQQSRDETAYMCSAHTDCPFTHYTKLLEQKDCSNVTVDCPLHCQWYWGRYLKTVACQPIFYSQCKAYKYN